MNNRRHYDLVIVGAGFAGLACAKYAAEAGLTVLVLDRKPNAGHAPHTTGIIVKEALEEFPVPSHLIRKVEGVRLYSPNLKHFDLRSPGYHFYATDTSGYLQFVAEQAENAGANLVFGSHYKHAYLQDDRIILEDLGVSCKYLVGADGARSSVAQDFGLGQNQSFLVGVEAEYENVGSLSEEHLHCFLNSSLARGYIAWAVPGVKVVQIGLACRPQYKPEISTLIDYLSPVFDFSKARLVGRRGGVIPVGGRVGNFASERVLLLGDAAGTVSPLTAGGIHPAFYMGRYAANVINEYLVRDGANPAQVLANIYPDFFWKKLLRLAFDQNLPDWFMESVIFSPPFRAIAQMTFFHSRGIWSGKAWKDIVAPIFANGDS